MNYAWCAPRIPGMFEMEQALGNEINKCRCRTDRRQGSIGCNGVNAWRSIMKKNGFFSSREPFAYSAVEAGTWAGRGKPSPI